MPSSSPAALLRTRLQETLLEANFHLFAAVCQDVLRAVGCQEVRLAGRCHFKGKNRDGGHDLEATIPGPLPRLVVIQIKQFRPSQRVFQRSVDELRGVALRAGAGEAILITSGPISHVLREAKAHLHASLLPVRLIDGEELLELLIAHEIGVQQVEERLVFDESYFIRQAALCVDRGQQEPYRRPHEQPQKTHRLPKQKSGKVRIRFEGQVHYKLLPSLSL